MIIKSDLEVGGYDSILEHLSDVCEALHLTITTEGGGGGTFLTKLD